MSSILNQLKDIKWKTLFFEFNELLTLFNSSLTNTNLQELFYMYYEIWLLLVRCFILILKAANNKVTKGLT
jgi:hypothetical protein